ncbi:sulfite reductase subunit alpha [Luteimonas suaedae]|uniref:sulfite reductase subunit alpha n=1 Tax=Luteimonas suaedae TaxID=2605430 RepID=UPI0011ECA64E|nr:sulfite reductase flavoprotein subunit alpha [Luteimonas suaedae]
MSTPAQSAQTRERAGNLLLLLALTVLALAMLPLHGDDWWLAPPRPGHWLWAALLLAAYAGLFARQWRGVRHARGATVTDAAGAPPLTVFWASQTGYARDLAERTAHSLWQAGIATRVRDLATLDPAALARTQRALFVVSTTGEGDPPDHVLRFAAEALSTSVALPDLAYAVLALGDREYTHYCGFGHALHRWLRQSGARPLCDPVEVDNGDPGALRLWQHHLSLLADAPDLSDWASPRYAHWTLRDRAQLNPGSAGGAAFHLALTPPEGTQPQWQAGDIAEIGPRNPAQSVSAWLAAIRMPGETPVTGPAGSEPLSALLARSHLPAADTVRGLDAQALAARLQPLPHREYSIASLPQTGRIELLLRMMTRADGRPGLGSGWLCRYAQPGERIALRIRSNPNFHPPDTARPLILIGNGTGIAGLRAHLQAREQSGAHRNWLLFGERNAAHDGFYGDEILRWRDRGHLQRIDLAFSRDRPGRYVQDALREAADTLRAWIADAAALYVCGSLRGMAPGVDAVLRDVLGAAQVEDMLAEGRYRRDVY